ncbi:MAG: decaprenyl-phosphate phosphoribosyltransferase [bacterium]
MKIKLLLRSLRPRQWTKNVLLFAGLIFSRNLFHTPLLIKTLEGFVCFCALSGSLYLLNDLLDVEQDRKHPEKSKRPLASGQLSVKTVVISAVILSGFALIWAFVIDTDFGYVAVSYFLLIVGYTLWFKNIVILDVIIIAIGFVLRAIAGAEIIDVTISSWLLMCAIFLALFLGLCKRRHELLIMGDSAESHRRILGEYSTALLDQMISVATASTVIAYAFYTTAPVTIEKFGTRNLILTLPFVLYGIFRYLYLVHRKKLGGSPELILLKDTSTIVNIFLYIVSVGVIIYWG